MEDRRKTQRDRALLSGRIAFNNRNFTVECLVRNISNEGARIAFSGAVAVPERFDITISSGGRRRKARLAWRASKEAGLTFLPSESEVADPADATDRIRKLEADRAALLRRVAELSGSA